MKKKFVFLDQFKSKLKNAFNFKKKSSASQNEDLEDEIDDEMDEDEEYDIDEELDLDDSSDQEEDEDDDEDFVPQPMTISRETKTEVERTQEMKRPSFDQLQEASDEDEDDNSDHDYTGEHSSVRKYKEFMLPKESHLKKLGGLTAFFSKIKNSFSKKPVAINARENLSKISQKIQNRRNKSSGSALTWDELIQSIFNVENRPKIHRTFIICLIAIGTYALGKIVATVLEGQQPSEMQTRSAPILQIRPENHQRDLQTIARSDLFNTQQIVEEPRGPVVVPPKVDENMVCLSAQRASSLPITIKHTTVLQDSVKSVASVQVRGQRDVLDMREGQKINNLAEIGRIDRQKVIVKNLSSGVCEFIQMEEEKGRGRQTPPIQVVSEERGRQIMRDAQPKGIRNEGNTFAIEKTLRDQMLSNISEVLTQARAVQIQNPDGSLAFKMTEIVPGSIYSQLNIQDGDIIEGINGDKITDLNAIMSMFGKIREIDNLSLTIKRDGTTRNFDYKFE